MDHEKFDVDSAAEEARSIDADEQDELERPELADSKVNSSPQQKKKKSSSGRPTRPLSAYNLFYRHERTKWLEGLKSDPETMKIPPKERFLAMGRHISKCWNELPESKKQKYKQEAAPYYKEFLEEKKQYKAKKSKEAIAERKLLEAAARKEMSRNSESNVVEHAARGQYETIAPSSVLNSIHPSFHHLPQNSVEIYASMMAQPQSQGIDEVLSALLGVQSRSTPPTTGVDLTHMPNTEQLLAQQPTTSAAFLEILHREQQHILMNQLLARNQPIHPQQALTSTEELQRVLDSTSNVGGYSNLDTSIAAILDLLRRSNSSGL
ncbi:hypothetical protein FisN_1Hh004 [Fistulifera solaris]|uniref:HMG box domain-containing protein n=1 Tax=Fistulifera solaris TaxID=1519565 RepID=A0A1Z5KST8_FISSO|nr:hypothetical protein FisN_1Hh004 [Fistulifera solaris]|eukprot:GAX28998.1 hypothetical protein FisN_1Hh004 [Fistulifera solaris]